MANINKTVESLQKNGISAIVVSTKEEAKQKVEFLLTEGSEVMQMTSVSLDDSGISQLINETGKYKAIRPLLWSAEENGLSQKDKTRMAAVPDFAVGSVHALTEDGSLVIASNTGSQLPAYAYGPGKVIFVVGSQKIVSTLDDAMKRIYDVVLPLESDRAHKAYGVPGSFVSKLLIIKKEVTEGRITVVIVEEPIGF